MTELFATVDKAADRKILAFDIETYKWEEIPALVEKIVQKKMDKRLKEPSKVQENIDSIKERFALDPLTGRIILCGFYDGSDHVSFIDDDERKLVKSALEYLGNAHYEGYRLLSKGGKRFDLPYLMMRAMILGVTPQFNVEWGRLVNKYQHWDHIDLESFFENGLWTIAYALGFTDQMENPGNEIAGMYEKKDWEEIVRKNQQDLAFTYKIFARMKWMNI